MYSEDDLIQLSALQHYGFCRRQCALIHIEEVWKENKYTIEGRLLHEKQHSEKSERRSGRKKEFGMPIRSLELGLSGKTDSVEYGEDGTVRIVEMKRGRPKSRDMDEIQLCAQALCLEEMLSIRIPDGFLFYGKKRRRKTVAFNIELRERTKSAAHEVHRFLDAGITPKPESTAKCTECSLIDVCLPDSFAKRKSVGYYIKTNLNRLDKWGVEVK